MEAMWSELRVGKNSQNAGEGDFQVTEVYWVGQFQPYNARKCRSESNHLFRHRVGGYSTQESLKGRAMSSSMTRGRLRNVFSGAWNPCFRDEAARIEYLAI